MTAVPPLAFTARGFVAPQTSAVQAGVQSDMQAAFGGNLNFTTSTGGVTNATPQSQLADSLTAIIDDDYATLAALFNGVDPALASGRMQDAIARIYFLTRNPALATAVECTCLGLAGTIIPNGAQAQDGSGNTYFCVGGGTIPGGGSIPLPFANTVPGPTPCPANTLTTIYQAVPGWDTITNPGDGVIGENTETRAAFELRRQRTVQANALGIIGSIVGAVAVVPGVVDFFGYNNGTAAPVTIYGVTIAARSIYISVAGGADLAVAGAILEKKAPGCGMVGNTTVTALDSNPLYSAPIPYSITFERPASVPIFFDVSIVNSTAVPSTAALQIQNALATAFSGDDGGARPRIASTIYASRFYAGVASLGAWAQIVSIKIGITTPGALDDVTMTAAQVPTYNPANVTVTLV